ncbi:hypothetical protein ACFLTH_08350 [Bacteroidota bacterium]
MKKYIIISMCVIMSSFSFSQTLTKAKIDSAIASLRSNDPLILIQATKIIGNYDLYEAIPELESNIVQKRMSDQIIFLQALVRLKAENSHAFVTSYINKLENYEPQESELFNPVELKLRAIQLLFLLNDYSYSDFVFGKVTDTTQRNHNIIVNMLYLLLNNSKENELKAKNDLIYGARYGEEIRGLCIDILEDKYGIEMLPLIVERFKEDEDFSVRLSILNDEFLRYESNLINDALKDRLLSEPSEIIRSKIARNLLVELGTISNYKYAIDWLYSSDTTDSALKKRIMLELKLIYPNTPPLPNISVTVETMLDTLISYTNQCYGFEWLKDADYENELFSIIQNAQNHLQSSDSLSCAKEIKSFQESIEQVYADFAGNYPKYISDEAYKFLYYYPKYILERLPEIPGVSSKEK